MKILIGILIPFFGTSLGSFMVFFMKDTINKNLERILLGFASGIMISASIWSLIIPAIELKGVIIVSIGFILGIMFLIIIECLISNVNSNHIFKKINMLFFSVTLHNIPERYGSRNYFFGGFN